MMTAIAALCLPADTQAQSIRAADIISAEVIPGWRSEDGTHMAALHLRLADGWKTYWRAPGELGIPPRFEWDGSQNISAVRLLWPRPVVFDQLGANSIGYVGELILPMEFTLRDAGAPARLATQVELGVCETICVPVSLDVSAELAPSASAPDPAITAALADRPQPAGSAGLRQVTCTVEMIPQGIRLTARMEMPPISDREFAVFELSDKSAWISDTATEREGGLLTARADIIPGSDAPFALERSDLRITILGEDSAVEMRGCPSG